MIASAIIEVFTTAYK